MKKIFVLALAAAAMVGCSNDEIIGLNQETIGFDNAFIENATRSIDPSITKETLSSFQVYGTTKGNEDGAELVSIFNYVTVEDTDATDAYKWEYAANYTQYWIADNIYNFAALKNAVKDNVTPGADLLPEEVTFTADGATDLLYARSEENIVGEVSGNEAVAFTFEHLLSKVQFTVKNTMTSNVEGNAYYYRVSDVQINNAYKTATCTLGEDENGTTKVWGAHTDAGMVDFGHVTAENATEDVAIAIGKVGEADEATSRLARLLVPATYTALNITCTIETLLNGSVVDVLDYSKNIAVTLAPGSAYNFVISKGAPGEKIEFTVNTVNGWDTTHGDTNVN